MYTIACPSPGLDLSAMVIFFYSTMGTMEQRMLYSDTSHSIHDKAEFHETLFVVRCQKKRNFEFFYTDRLLEVHTEPTYSKMLVSCEIMRVNPRNKITIFLNTAHTGT